MYKVLENNIEYDVECEGINNIWFHTIYYHKGKRSRVKGPAVEYSSGLKEWWLDGEKFNCSSQAEFEKLLRLKAFL